MFPIRSWHGSRPRVTRLQLEALEERLVLNNRFVVPVGVPVDNATTFLSLKSALSTAGLGSGDIIQLEPGATPGNIGPGIIPALANLTIQGDPATVLASIPQFTVSDAMVVPGTNAGFTLKNVNVGLIATGSIQFFNSTTITGSALVDINSTALTGFLFTPVAASNVTNSITNSTLANVGAGNLNSLVFVVPSNGTGNSTIFANNTFASNSTIGIGSLLLFTSTGNVTLSGSLDKVIGNTFLGIAGSQLNALFVNNATSTGLTVQGNTFSDPDNGVIALALAEGTFTAQQTTVVIGNTFNLTGAGAIGIGVVGGDTGAQAFADLRNNQITMRNGTALRIDGTNAAGMVMVRAQANDFHGSKIGVLINVNASSGGNLKVDLGSASGSTFGGSQGANNFHGFSPANANQGSILVVGTNPTVTFTLFAEKDIFTNTPPTIFLSPGLSNVAFDATNSLFGNAAFVETLYVDFLKRTGDTSNAADAGFWVTALTNNTMTPAQVANALLHSAEGLGILVDGLYQKLLNRASDAGGRGFFINLLQHGTTVDQVISLLVTSPEFAALSGSDSGYVQSLYVKLLGRIAANAETAYWLAQLPTLGRAGVVNGLLASAEFRADVVQEMYGFPQAPAVSVASVFAPLLHRTAAPATTEVNFWVNGGLDLLAIETAFAQTGEFVANG